MNERKHLRRGGLRRTPAIGTVLMTAALLTCNAASAADGDLDPTFGTGGFRFAGVTGAAFLIPPKVAVQPDGKIIYCSELQTGSSSGEDFLVERYNADGSLDTSFNFDGKVTIDFDSNNDGCNAVAIQANGKIIVIGASAPTGTFNYDFAVVRLNTDGSLDASFGAGTGKTTVAFDRGGNNQDYGAEVALQTDGNIVIAGMVETPTDYDFGIVRLLPDGSRDTAFNVTGRVTVAFDLPASTNRLDWATAVAIDDAGRIVAAGIADAGPGRADFAVARLLSSGQLDQAFDADGRATLAFDLGATNSDYVNDMILQRDGKIVIVGSADTGSGMTSNLDTAIARLLPDGSPDPGFGIGGKVLVPYDLIADGTDVAYGVLEDTVGRLVVVGGAVSSAAMSRAVMARLLGNGTLDASFGSFGKKVFDFGTDGAAFTGVALQGTQLIGGGQASTGTDQDDFVARIEVDLIFADGFE